MEARHFERRLAVSGLERDPGCHPEASLRAGSERELWTSSSGSPDPERSEG